MQRQYTKSRVGKGLTKTPPPSSVPRKVVYGENEIPMRFHGDIECLFLCDREHPDPTIFPSRRTANDAIRITVAHTGGLAGAYTLYRIVRAQPL